MSGHVPSFSSFPDFDNPESSSKKDRKEHKSRKEKHKSREGLVESSRRRRSRSKSRERDGSHRRIEHKSRKDEKRGSSHLSRDQDERVKAREDQEIQRSENRHEEVYTKDYFVDKKGDKMNITYGGLHKGDVPKFHRTGRGKILGLTTAWTIHGGTSNKELTVTLRHRPKALYRYTESRSYRHLLEGPRQHIPLPASSIPFQSEIVELSRPKKTKEPEETYRSIVAPNEASDSEDSRSELSASSDELELSLSADQEAMKELEVILNRSPDSETAWLKLWDISLKSVPKTTSRGVNARADISLSILRRALDSHDENKESPRLRLLYIQQASQIWSDDRIRAEWDNLLSQLGGTGTAVWKRGVVWAAWLEWRLSNSPSVNEAIIDTKRAILELKDDSFEMLKVRICWRIAIFLKEAGFLEQAFAILQAQIELSHFCPVSLASQPLSSKLEHLEEFWEAEVPRLGEENAKGWAKWHVERTEVTQYLRHHPNLVTGIEDPYQQWYCQEQAQDQIWVLPSRSFNEDESDPYSTIIFSDIKGFLFDLRQDAAKEYLRLALLSFTGLNIPGISRIKVLDDNSLLSDAWMMSGNGGWASNPERLFPPIDEDRLITWESHAGTTVGTERPKKSGFGPVKDWVKSRSLLEGSGVACGERAWEAKDVDNIDISPMRRLVLQLATIDHSDTWQEILVSLDGATDIKQGIKDSKKRLEQRQSSITLWRNHAKLERIRGKNAEAAKIYNMAISIDPQSFQLPVLVADGVEFFWFREEQSQAQVLLANYLGIQGALAGLNLLRARKGLDAKLSHYEEADKQWEACVRLRFFLELGATTPRECISTIDSLVAENNTSESTHERVSMWLCLTLFSISHLPGAAIPPTLVRGRVSVAVAQYPDNTVLLGLFLECERGYGIWGRVRSLLDSSHQSTSSTLDERASLSRIAWEVWAESWSYGPWEAERVRNKLEHAVSLAKIKHSVLFWQIYLSFELRVRDMKRAKSILLRALGNCPWAKELYMMAAGPLRSMFKPSELNDLVATMIERGIRMRCDIEELLEGWVDPDTMHDDEDQPMGDAELEIFMHDREQAKPF